MKVFRSCGLKAAMIAAAMLLLGSTVAYAQTPGQIPMFDPLGTAGFCNSAVGRECVDSVITQDVNNNIFIGLGVLQPNLFVGGDTRGNQDGIGVRYFHEGTALDPLGVIDVIGNFFRIRGGRADLGIIDRMHFDLSTGTVGIGTTSPDPATKLHVVQSGTFSPAGLFVNTGQGVRGISTGGIGAGDVGVWGTSEVSAGVFGNTNNPNATGVLARSAGASNANDGLGVQGHATITGRVLAAGYDVSSDIRLKENITPLTSVLEKIERIRGVTFDWNDRYAALGRSTGRREIGVIAQEVEAVFPELVTTWGDESYRVVDYGRLTGVLIEGLKEQQAQIRDLRAQNSELKARLEALEQLVKATRTARSEPTE
jgi:hypothetical protein